MRKFVGMGQLTSIVSLGIVLTAIASNTEEARTWIPHVQDWQLIIAGLGILALFYYGSIRGRLKKFSRPFTASLDLFPDRAGESKILGAMISNATRSISIYGVWLEDSHRNVLAESIRSLSEHHIELKEGQHSRPIFFTPIAHSGKIVLCIRLGGLEAKPDRILTKLPADLRLPAK